MRLLLLCFYVLLPLIFCSCSTFVGYGAHRGGKDSLASESGYPSDLWDAKSDPSRIPASHLGPSFPGVVLRDTPEVRSFIRKFTSSSRPFVAEAMPRRERYLPLIDKVLLEHGLPLELSNIAWIESRFIAQARSSQGAVGMWQFMKPTARSFGLRVSMWKDERKDVRKSTVAAAKYLSHLYLIYDDWLLAIAAYNAGPARINRALKQCPSRDFFEISRRGLVKKETRDFVAKFIAVSMISRNLDLYGFLDEQDKFRG